MNRLYYGDNLPILREHIAAESVDLVYLDPPFNSNAIVPLLGLSSMVIQGIAFAVVYGGVIQPMSGGWLIKAATYAALGGFLSWSFTTIAAAAKSPTNSVRDFFTIETAFTAVRWIIVGLVTALVVG